MAVPNEQHEMATADSDLPHVWGGQMSSIERWFSVGSAGSCGNSGVFEARSCSVDVFSLLAIAVNVKNNRVRRRYAA